MGARRALAQHGRGSGLNSNHLYLGVLALQIFAGAGNGAAGAHACHKNIHLAIGILPDLRPRGGLVGSGIGRVHKLAGNKGAGGNCGQLLGLGDSALHALCAIAQHQLGAVCLHQLAALNAHGFGHYNDNAIAPGCCHAGQANARVAAGGLNDHTARLQQALGLGIIDHGLGHTILHRTGGIKIFQLGQQSGLQVFLLFDMRQFQQRGFSDQLVSGCVNIAHGAFPPFFYILYYI